VKVAVAPFLLPPTDVAIHLGWEMSSERPVALPRRIDAWDYQSQLRLRAKLVVETERLCGDSGLSGESELVVLVTAKSTSTKIERCVFRKVIPRGERAELLLDLDMKSDWLGGRLLIQTQIVAKRPLPLGNTAASVVGAILWSVRHETTLEGDGGLFPTDSENFRETRPLHSTVPWMLTVDTADLDALFAAAVRLSLNSSVPAVSNLLADGNTKESKRLAKILELDVTRQLASIAIRSGEIAARTVEPEGDALGDVLRLLVARIWPAESMATLSMWLVERPERIEADIQEFVGAFR